MEIIQDGDQFFETLWNQIDGAEKCVWILTYHMVDNFIPNETLRRCIAAADRGVSVVLYVDYLNYFPD
jgi:phosphatidylserine/phosphatidylglycerophosphate/cardiolipin synthase-like enzyme